MHRPPLARLPSVAPIVLVVLALGALPPGAFAQQRDTSDAALIRSAVSAAPRRIGDSAAVIAPTSDGKMRQLRAGTNDFTCIPDDPGTPDPDPMCLDGEGMKWAQSWMGHEEKPGNTGPGLGYMLRGGSDISATDPWQKTTSNYIASPPHYMILWPFDAKTSGLPTAPKKTGSWIMWPGTPYAHLMVNQVP